MTSLPVVCIEEASWGFDARTELTVAHMLRLLEQDGWIESVHIRVSSADQLRAALKQWALSEPRRLKLVYLSLHGVRGGVSAGPDDVPLEQIASWMDGQCGRRIVHLGSCEVVTDEQACRDFVRKTRARAVCGYTTQIGWLAPVAFELLLIAAVANEPRSTAALALEDVRRSCAALARPLGFRVYRHPDTGGYDPAERADLPGL